MGNDRGLPGDERAWAAAQAPQTLAPPISRRERATATGLVGATVWLTGLPAAGKSTLAGALERSLVQAGRPAYVLDGDLLRAGLSSDLGYDDAARSEQSRRVSHVALTLADAGTVAIVALISPFAADRARARALHDEAGLPFLEVFVDTPASECARRDPKGLYAGAHAGSVANLTGAGGRYEPPAAPDVRITTLSEPVSAAVARLRAVLDGVAPHQTPAVPTPVFAPPETAEARSA